MILRVATKFLAPTQNVILSEHVLENKIQTISDENKKFNASSSALRNLRVLYRQKTDDRWKH